MNMLKQTAGVGFSAAGKRNFHWLYGPLNRVFVGVSTCNWRGVHVRDVLLACGLQDQGDTERWFLNFEGSFHTVFVELCSMICRSG